MKHELKSPEEAENEIARVFYEEPSNECVISCQDESAFFEQKRFDLGTIRLAQALQSEEQSDNPDLAKLIKLGAFEWRTPTIDDAKKNMSEALKVDGDMQDSDLDRVLGDVSSIIIRTGLLHPSFDPVALEDMPYRRSTTVASDTSGVLQGGLDFVARFLHPAARIKIPAMVHMELIGSSDNFFILRRRPEEKKKESQRRRELTEHLKSQGGQRALLRLELQSDTEVERTFLLGDPLRSAFDTDKDDGMSGLNISRPIKSYADRLILEATRHHQAQSGPAHKVHLLTSDQGLARMALAEGIAPLYFSATKAEDFFGTRLTGRILHPFTGEAREISLASVLWELATAFGSVRLEGKDSKNTFEVSALGKELSWSPYQSSNDLLWCTRYSSSRSPVADSNEIWSPTLGGPSASSSDRSPAADGNESAIADAAQASMEDKPSQVRHTKPTQHRIAFLQFNVERLLHLVFTLDDDQEMNAEEIVKFLGLKSRNSNNEYRRFLTSAELVSIENQVWKATPELGRLSAAIRNKRTEEMQHILLTVPSYKAFAAHIAELDVGQTLGDFLPKRGMSTYRILGEITLICAQVQGKGIYSTPENPDVEEFADIARERFRELVDADGLVATGDWLESLIQKNGIHPQIAQRQLNKASEHGLLQRSTEGSTTQTRYNSHNLHVLRVESGKPIIDIIHLYRGDFLIPGKASVSLRIGNV